MNLILSAVNHFCVMNDIVINYKKICKFKCPTKKLNFDNQNVGAIRFFNDHGAIPKPSVGSSDGGFVYLNFPIQRDYQRLLKWYLCELSKRS